MKEYLRRIIIVSQSLIYLISVFAKWKKQYRVTVKTVKLTSILTCALEPIRIYIQLVLNAQNTNATTTMYIKTRACAAHTHTATHENETRTCGVAVAQSVIKSILLVLTYVPTVLYTVFHDLDCVRVWECVRRMTCLQKLSPLVQTHGVPRLLYTYVKQHLWTHTSTQYSFLCWIFIAYWRTHTPCSYDIHSNRLCVRRRRRPRTPNRSITCVYMLYVRGVFVRTSTRPGKSGRHVVDSSIHLTLLFLSTSRKKNSTHFEAPGRPKVKLVHSQKFVTFNGLNLWMDLCALRSRDLVRIHSPSSLVELIGVCGMSYFGYWIGLDVTFTFVR